MVRQRHDNSALFLFLLIGTVALLIGCNQPETKKEAPRLVLSADNPVSVTGGQIQGEVSDTNPEVIAFTGVPFAAPPTGGLRWQPPKSVIAWDGVRDAKTPGPLCMQAGSQDQQQSEDCLYLNVWTQRESTEPLPVMVWIHGGGYRLGSGSGYDGTPLASRDVVLVTFNYRLNVFGFLAHPALSVESEQNASGNYGLMDMIAALEWVQDNIVQFGGDPDRVTIFGESAGGGSVMTLMIVPQAEGLFHRAISQSTYVPGWDRGLTDAGAGWEAAEIQGAWIAKALSAPAADPLPTMRAATSAAVIEAAKVGFGSVFTRTPPVWAPNVDGWIVPNDPLIMYRESRQHNLPLITGMTGNEGSLFRSRAGITNVEDFESYVHTHYPTIASEALAFYQVTSADRLDASIDHLIHDMVFAGPVRAQLKAHAQVASAAWLYSFAQVPPTDMGTRFGAHHAAELPYVFGTMGSDTPWTDIDRKVSDLMMSYWTQFAATGNPNRENLPTWPTFDASDRHITFAADIEEGTGLHREGAALFDRYEESLRVKR